MNKFGIMMTALVLAGAAWYFHSTVTPPLPRPMDEEQNVEKAKLLALGIPRAELIEELGEPLETFFSKDGRYELLRFSTPPTSPGLIAAAVERQSGKVVSLNPGEGPPRSAEGFVPSDVQWNYSVRNPAA